MRSRYNTARKQLIFWTLFIGIGAVGGAMCMLIDPSGRLIGMDALLVYFKKLPLADILFEDYAFSGIALLLVNGIPNLIAAGLLFAHKKFGVICGGILGVTLMLWICIQFYMFPFNFMDTAYFIFGAIQAATGYAAGVFSEQERFLSIAEACIDNDNIGKAPERLVVYFSRMGYVRKAAFEEAKRTGARIYEIKAKEHVSGTAGFWQCGRYGMLKRKMPIEEITVDLTEFSHVTICTPVWVFALAAPTRTFCETARGKIREADYIIVHNTRARYKNVASEMDRLLGINYTDLRSLSCKIGKFKEII